MTLKELEARVVALEQAMARLQAEKSTNGSASLDPDKQQPWWREEAGRYKDDPLFDEMMREVQKYRESLDPDLYPKKAKTKKNTGRRKDARS